MLDLYQIRDDLSRQGLLIGFNGPFSHSIIEELGKAVRRYLEGQDLEKNILMDVFSVYIEQTQNVQAYCARKGFTGSGRPDLENGIIVIGREGDRYLISSGNIICREDIPALEAWLQQLQQADTSRLKQIYKQKLREDRSPDCGAGLGLLDMARKAREPLEYHFRQIDEQFAFFALLVKV